MLLLRAREAAMGYFRPGLKEHGITEQQWRVLRALNEQEELTAAGLAEATVILAPSMTRILRKLAKDRMIHVKRAAEDQRQVRVRLAPRGKRLIESFGPLAEKQYRLIEQRMRPDRLAELYDLLNDFIELESGRANTE